ncbi:hypothetical protein HYU13_02525 [Candidatus Woesearchaeota archaeon]|nr:hypothetical protein [Candidatus Woesearchaeota archaeon]
MNAFISGTKNFFSAIRLMLSSRKHLLITLATALLMSLLVWLLPFFLNPNLTQDSQVERLGALGIALFVIFSFVVGMTVGMNSYASSLRRQEKPGTGKNVGTGAVGAVGALFSGPLCISCLGGVLSSLGLSGSVGLFLFSYSTAISAISFALLLGALYFATQRVRKVC